MDLKQAGILLDPNTTHLVEASLFCEAPVNLSDHNVFCHYCAFGAYTYVNAPGVFSNVIFGRYCSIAAHAWFGPPQHDVAAFSTHPFIYDHEHMTARFGNFEPYQRIIGTKPYSGHATFDPKRPDIFVGNDVWIGARVMVMNGVTIGDGAVIAANAVVTQDVEPYTIVGGVPAKPIRKRFSDDLIRQFAEVQWWRYDMAHVSNRVDYGNPQGVIDFITREIEAARLPALNPSIFEVRRKAIGFEALPI